MANRALCAMYGSARLTFLLRGVASKAQPRVFWFPPAVRRIDPGVRIVAAILILWVVAFTVFPLPPGDLSDGTSSESVVGVSARGVGSRIIVASTDKVTVVGIRCQLPDVLEGSWCESGWTVIEQKQSVKVAETELVAGRDSITLSGIYKVLPEVNKVQDYKPSRFFQPGQPKPIGKNAVISNQRLDGTVCVEYCGTDGLGLGVIQLQSDWRGLSYGPVSAWKFDLKGTVIYVVDSDFDGKPTNLDRVTYEGTPYWMPWHSVTAHGQYYYYELAIEPSLSMTASMGVLGDLGDDSDVARKWNVARLFYGVPPGVFDLSLGPSARKHADYLKTNGLATHDEDPKLPGYSEDGNLAGLSSLITFEGKDEAVDEIIGTYYHRRLMLDPSYSILYLGGNDYAYCLGIANIRTRLQSKLPTEQRTMPYPLMSPAPGMAITYTTLGRETPEHPKKIGAQPLGYPVMLILPNYSTGLLREPPKDVKAELKAVKGTLRSGKTSSVVECHLSYPGFNTPDSDPHNAATIALAPLHALNVGGYEASFEFKYLGKPYNLRWRFEVVDGKKK